MKIFIINLAQSTERRKKMEAQLTQSGFQHEFITAVEGRKFSEQALRSQTREINYAFLPGEVGCALSHQKIYQKMVNENIDTALILEDDVRLNADLDDLLDKIKIPQNDPTVILLSRVNKFIAKPVTALTDRYTLHKVQQATTAHSYILNQKAAQSLLKALYPIWMVADKWTLFEDLSLIKVFAIQPHPIQLSEDAQNSTINVQKGNSDIDMKKTEIWEMLMSRRPLKAKIRHRIRRAITPLFNRIIDQGKG